MLSPNRLLISKLSCLNYTFIQLFTCQTFIWPTKHLCLTSDLQISKRNLQSHNEGTTPEPPYLWLMIHQVLRNLFSSADSHWYFICRSVTAAYSVITKPSCRSEGRSIFRARCSPINTHYVSGGEVNLGHTHTHTQWTSADQMKALMPVTLAFLTHTPLVLFPAAVGALKLWYLRNSNQFQTSASSHVSSTLEGDLKLSLIYSHIAFGCGGNLFSQPLDERRRGKQSLCMLSFVLPVGNRWTSVKTVRSSCVFESFQGLSECCSKQSVHWQLFFTPCSWAHVEISLILSCVSQSGIMGVAVFLVKQRSLLMKIYLIHHLPSFLPLTVVKNFWDNVSTQLSFFSFSFLDILNVGVRAAPGPQLWLVNTPACNHIMAPLTCTPAPHQSIGLQWSSPTTHTTRILLSPVL